MIKPYLSPQDRIDAIRTQLTRQGIHHPGAIHADLSSPQLYEMAIRRNEGHIASGGALVVATGQYTGRSANDKFIVDERSSRDRVAWGAVNRPFPEADYEKLRTRVTAFLQDREIFVQDCRVGADPHYQRRVRVITTHAWQSLFARNLFITSGPPADKVMEPDFTLINAGGFQAVPEIDGTRSEAFILLHLGRREALIGGTAYAGENKKVVFTLMNYLLPLQGVLPMHCSANIGEEDDVAIFFGLSGTGKTTLSTDPRRRMIGDDEHGWSDEGVFNLEGGCYAKVIRLHPQAEPDIWNCTRTFGTVLENVILDPATRRVNLDDATLTENTRAAYPLHSLPRIQFNGKGGHPANVILLTADAFGIMPPVARLTIEQTMYHFLSGYTAKLGGTERGVKEPTATFSACFGEPFMALDPVVYASLLGEKLTKTQAKCWLINTGWTGGPYGEGFRMPIQETRTIIDQIFDNQLDSSAMRIDPTFGFEVPVDVCNVDPMHLDPRTTWKDPTRYDAAARQLANRFRTNFAEKFADRVSAHLLTGGPILSA
ncbi:MAG: phosphoenolpyruvate carboxykinase (ATP) [Magnetococcales bacterium]|nr:phosphoenolpyruvate carboxykinase (ATP) [Magnetococcales bacterium]NGZ05791.1 phosphoenolpyruvate carboxykinase (ATP) [Magnetococcales bacterium]